MRNLLLYLTLILTVFSCQNSDDETFVKPKAKQIYFDKVCHGDDCSYVHYIQLSSYNEANFNEYDFVYMADKYLDSVTVMLPVQAIQFCKPFDFEDIGGSENDDQLNENGITKLWYNWDGITDKTPDIGHISIWSDGKRKDLDYLTIIRRQNRVK